MPTKRPIDAIKAALTVGSGTGSAAVLLLALLPPLARESGHSERTISTANPLLALSMADGRAA
ncbi:hypothetical protein OHB53_00680 [Streptomyces sp. NBC_00056]|uniref:hypothetical protein n=1 Tax=unclassified Streptomyces TaxID=2593676 RepID=UPI002E37B86C|nr:hypothetical protein [Streptomyces sp. NBC_01280]